MNQTMQDLLTRRSCRKFKPDMVEKELIDQVIEAGLYAPSGKGLQSAKIIAVTNKELRDKIAEDNRQIGGWDPGFDPFYGAPVILIVVADKSSPMYMYDGPLAMGNLMNAAHALGLGSIWIHRAKQEFEMPYYQDLLKKLGLEGEYEGIGHCALGYAAAPAADPIPRKDDRVFFVD